MKYIVKLFRDGVLIGNFVKLFDIPVHIDEYLSIHPKESATSFTFHVETIIHSAVNDTIIEASCESLTDEEVEFILKYIKRQEYVKEKFSDKLIALLVNETDNRYCRFQTVFRQAYQILNEERRRYAANTCNPKWGR